MSDASKNNTGQDSHYAKVRATSIIKELDGTTKKELYRMLRSEKVRGDVEEYAQSLHVPLSEESMVAIADIYTSDTYGPYGSDRRYDPNRSYSGNLEVLINEMYQTQIMANMPVFKNRFAIQFLRGASSVVVNSQAQLDALSALALANCDNGRHNVDLRFWIKTYDETRPFIRYGESSILDCAVLCKCSFSEIPAGMEIKKFDEIIAPDKGLNKETLNFDSYVEAMSEECKAEEEMTID